VSVLIGTSAFTASGWVGSFYPQGIKPADQLSFYSTQFHTVEVDSTYYRTPPASTVHGWYARTPKDFIFAAKVPQIITHEKVLEDCEAEFDGFVDRMELLREKLGPLLLQFPYFNKTKFKAGREFIARLVPFLKRLPKTPRFAVEIRNKSWLVPDFIATLREYHVALAIIDQSWMPRPREWFDKFDPITTDFTYIRLLGDRKGIEQTTKTWDKTVVNRTTDLIEWAKILQETKRRGVKAYVYANNHYAGHSPATARTLEGLLKARSSGS
jgi:uncharacterized protein YecE (DUF72 family)